MSAKIRISVEQLIGILTIAIYNKWLNSLNGFLRNSALMNSVVLVFVQHLPAYRHLSHTRPRDSEFAMDVGICQTLHFVYKDVLIVQHIYFVVVYVFLGSVQPGHTKPTTGLFLM